MGSILSLRMSMITCMAYVLNVQFHMHETLGHTNTQNTVETILHMWKVTPKNYAVLLKFLRQP